MLIYVKEEKGIMLKNKKKGKYNIMPITIKESKGYKNSIKKIKNNYEAKDKIEKIISYLEVINSFEEIKNDVVLKMYGYEELREDLSGYYRFGIDKNSKTGKLRLLFSKIDNNAIQLEYISTEHYRDFKRYLRD